MATITKEPLAGEESRVFYAFLLGLCAVLLNAPRLLAIFKVRHTEKIVLWYQHNSHNATPPALVDFQRRFLSVFFLFGLAEALQGVYGEALYQNRYSYSAREIGYMIISLHASSLVIGTMLGAAADSIGRKRACIISGFFQLTACCLDSHSGGFYVGCSANVCRGVAVSVFPSAFEAWLTSEHERLGFKQEWLSRTFWVMACGMGVSAIAAGSAANFLVYRLALGVVSPPLAAAAVSSLWVFLLWTGWTETVSSSETSQASGLREGIRNAIQAVSDIRIMLLGWSQACFELSLAMFWLLWAPTMVSDGREIHSGLLYTYFMGSLMLGSVIASFILCGPCPLRPETFLPWIFIALSLSLLVPAYDYQEISVLVAAFCAFHVCVGIAWPSLARLRNIYIPSDRRAGVLSLYRVPWSIGVVLILIQSVLMKQLYNSKIFYICAVGLFSGAGSLHLLNKRRRSIPSSEDSLWELHRHH